MFVDVIQIICVYLSYTDILILRKTSRLIRNKIPSRFLNFEDIIKNRLQQLNFPPKLFDALKSNRICIGGEFITSCLYDTPVKKLLIIIPNNISSPFTFTIPQLMKTKLLIIMNLVYDSDEKFENKIRLLTYHITSSFICKYILKIQVNESEFNESCKYLTISETLRTTSVTISKNPTEIEMLSYRYPLNCHLYDWNEIVEIKYTDTHKLYDKFMKGK